MLLGNIEQPWHAGLGAARVQRKALSILLLDLKRAVGKCLDHPRNFPAVPGDMAVRRDEDEVCLSGWTPRIGDWSLLWTRPTDYAVRRVCLQDSV